MVYAKKADFNAIGQELGISPFLARIIRNRDVIGTAATREFLTGTLRDIPSPRLLHDMDKAADILSRKIAENARIRIIGDYDVDGITSSYILYRMLSFLGADVSVRLPDRIIDGYGINVRLVEEAIADGVDTILTCDNGIAARDVLQMAKDRGLTVIVTDHHEIPKDTDGNVVLPPADAIVEPKVVNPETGETYYPFTEICGAQVAYKLSSVMLEEPDISGDRNRAETPQQRVMRELLGFAALGCVCDVMPLIGENRILVREGLHEVERTENIGLAALILSAGLGDVPLTAYHAGFVIGPCLNASGRLDSAERALRLFMETDFNKAMTAADELRALNEDRKQMTEDGCTQAMASVDEMLAARGTAADRVLVVILENCHESLAGIIAGRIRERYARPTFVLTASAEDPGSYKGSGRSIEAYDMYGAMSAIQDVFTKFGGHKMAAGLTIARDRVEEFKRRLNENCELTDADLQDTVHIDMELPMRYVSKELVHELERLAPYGNQNPRPLFVTRDVDLCLVRIMGKNQNALKFTARDDQNHTYDCMMFTRPHEAPAELTPGRHLRAHIVYRPDIHEWQGRESLQYIIEDYRIL